MIIRAGAGLAAAFAVAALAYRAGALSRSGLVAATAVGGASVAAGWNWGALLVGWFVASSALTRVGAHAKADRTRATLAPGHARTATQVIANGALFAAAALLHTLTGDARAALAALGALAAAAADTWATEIGLLWGGAPRSLVTMARVESGMSGGVTGVGLLASVAGAFAVALGAVLLEAPDRGGAGELLLLVTTAGVLGGLADSLLGATLQATRWCASCARWTERATHDCGTRTSRTRGLHWMTNDAVNVFCTMIGAAAAVALLAARG